ncbi:MAG: HDOD domain-containing protein [Zoogloea sp.]|nr:HDOD domain-containing protein [Zoogloea sp.]
MPAFFVHRAPQATMSPAVTEAMNSSELSLDLAGWIARIRGREMPVFGRTVDALRALIADDKASASALAKVILMDAPMTTKVLRLANSAFFNHSHQGISTVSRAIVVLGFDPVVELALSVSLIDSLLNQGIRERVHAEMARSFHAAVQARWIARKRGEGAGEEVFIAALLGRVGEMAFWCFGGEQAQRLDQCLVLSGGKEEEAQQRVLGFPLRQLSHGLVKEWKLGPLVSAAMEMDPRGRGPGRSILLAHRLARVADEGWDSIGGRQSMHEVADYLDQPVATVREDILANAAEAARVARVFGAPEAAGLIPQAAPLPETAAPPAPVDPDARLQLRILHDLAEMSLARANIADVLQMVVEGVYRAIGCRRVVVALLTEDRQSLVGRIALGADADALAARFVFPMEGEPDDVLDAAIDSGEAALVNAGRLTRPGAERLVRAAACSDCGVVPIGTASRQIGVLYVDCGGKPLAGECWDAVRHFALQASLAVELGATERRVFSSC